jgi:hypothetical protein
VAAAEMISVLSKMTFAAKDEFLKGFTQTFASEIERHVEATAKKRQADPLKAVSAGTELIKNVADQLKNLKEARGKNDLMYTSVADKVASELLECAIVNYNEYQSRVHKGVEQSLPRIVEIIERKSTPSAAYARRILNEARPYLSQLKAATETDAKKIAYSSSAMEKLLKKGQSLAVGMMVINRYEKNAPGILKGVDTQDIYLVMSSRLASSAEKMCVDEVNACIARGLGSIENLRRLGETMTESLEVYAMIEKMDLMQEFRTALDTRKQQLSEMYDKIPPLPNFGREPQRQKTVDDMKEREELRARFYQSGDDGERAARERAAIKRWKEERAAKRSKAILWTFIIVGMVVGGYYMGVSAGRYAAGALGGGAAGWLAAVIINGIIKGITKN